MRGEEGTRCMGGKGAVAVTEEVEAVIQRQRAPLESYINYSILAKLIRSSAVSYSTKNKDIIAVDE